MNGKEYQKQYYIKNRKRILKRIRQYRINNKEKRMIQQHKYYLKNKDYLMEANRRYKTENKENVSKQRKRYYQDNIEKVKELQKQWRENNPEKMKEWHRKYFKTEIGRASKQRALFKRRTNIKNSVNTLTAQEWANILEAHNYRCAYCGVEFNCGLLPTRDHIIPISKGGHNTKENVVPACKSCNSKKYNKIIHLRR